MMQYPKTKHFILVLIFLLVLQVNLEADAFYIIYTSNINGAIENCGCGVDPLGGIDRIKSFIDQFRKDNENVLLIDGGDYFNSYPFPALNEAMYKALIHIKYDCVVPGDQEFVEGDDFFLKYSSFLKDKLLLSNGGSGYKKNVEANFGNYQVRIFGYLSPYIFDFIEKPKELNLSNFVNEHSNKSKQNELKLAVIHGYLSNAEQVADEDTSIDLILLAHDQRRGIWKKNNTPIIGNGKDAEYISIIKVSRDDQWNINIDQKKINQEMPKDDQIISLIEEYKKK